MDEGTEEGRVCIESMVAEKTLVVYVKANSCQSG